MAYIIKPPTSLDVVKEDDRPVIFLAGSIEQGKAVDWQTRVEKAFAKFDLFLLNPRRDEWDASWVQHISNPQFRGQVEWELEALELANTILMYFDPNTMSPISLLELGLFAHSDKLVVCCPEGYWRKGNVDIVCRRYNVPQVDTIEDMIYYAQIRHRPQMRKIEVPSPWGLEN